MFWLFLAKLLHHALRFFSKKSSHFTHPRVSIEKCVRCAERRIRSWFSTVAPKIAGPQDFHCKFVSRNKNNRSAKLDLFALHVPMRNNGTAESANEPTAAQWYLLYVANCRNFKIWFGQNDNLNDNQPSY